MPEENRTPQAKAAEVASEIMDGKPMKGSDTNPVQVSTEDLKLGEVDSEAELREKTAHVGRIASNVTSAASKASNESKDLPTGSDTNPVEVSTSDSKNSDTNPVQVADSDSKGSDTNSVQVATSDLKMGKDDSEAELREKTAHVGEVASRLH